MADALGSVRLTLDGSGRYQDAVPWDASGNMRTDDTSDGYGFGYAGEQYDASSDLYIALPPNNDVLRNPITKSQDLWATPHASVLVVP